MALTFEFPDYEDDAKNPAERWLQDFDSELGFTEPFLNGGSLLSRASRFGAAGGGNQTGWTIDAPEILVTDLQGHDYTSLHPPIASMSIFGDDISEEDPRDVRANRDWNYGRFVGELVREPINRFSWKVTIPPPGPWTVAATKDQLQKLVVLLSRETPVPTQQPSVLLRTIQQSSQQNWTLQVVAKPPYTLGQIRVHTRVHETQHVIDHLHVIQAMFGPWDNHLARLKRENISISGSSRANVFAAIQNARGFDARNKDQSYTPGLRRIVEEVIRELIWSGSLYHNTPQGAPCKRQIRALTHNSLIVEIGPQTLLTGPSYVSVNQLASAPSTWVWRETYIQG